MWRKPSAAQLPGAALAVGRRQTRQAAAGRRLWGSEVAGGRVLMDSCRRLGLQACRVQASRPRGVDRGQALRHARKHVASAAGQRRLLLCSAADANRQRWPWGSRALGSVWLRGWRRTAHGAGEGGQGGQVDGARCR